MLCTQMTQNYRSASLHIAIGYVGACYNLHYYPQMEQFDWSEMTYYNIILCYGPIHDLNRLKTADGNIVQLS